MKYLIYIKNLIDGFINYCIFKYNNVQFQKFKINGVIKVQNKGSLIIGNNFGANSGVNANPIGGDSILRLIVFKENAVLKIGNNVGISNSSIICWKRIEIGNNVIIGGGCKIWDTNFHSLNSQIRTSGYDDDIKTDAIKIENNVFIGAGAIILKGVSIGEHSIIAAGSVVHKSIPPNVIAGGNPCLVIKSINN